MLWVIQILCRTSDPDNDGNSGVGWDAVGDGVPRLVGRSETKLVASGHAASFSMTESRLSVEGGGLVNYCPFAIAKSETGDLGHGSPVNDPCPRICYSAADWRHCTHS